MSKRDLFVKKIEEKKEENKTSYIDSIIENSTDTNQIQFGNADKFIPYDDEKLRLDIHSGDSLDRLRESIETNGIMQPIIVVPHNNKFMIISGHNRVYIAKQLGIKVPYILKDNLTKEEMDLICIDTNLLNRQITEFKASQLAYILKKKMDAEKHQGSSFHGETKYTGDKIGEEYGLSRTMIFRYIKLNDLIDEALEMVDNKEITIRTAYELTFFKQEIQKVIIDAKEQFKINEKMLKILRDNMVDKNFENIEDETTCIKSQLYELCFTAKQTHRLDYRNIKNIYQAILKITKLKNMS